LHVNLILSFLLSLAAIDRDHRGQYAHLEVGEYVASIFGMVPWGELVSFADTTVESIHDNSSFERTGFTTPEHGGSGALPEDYLARGQVWSRLYLPERWFADEGNYEERAIEHASTVDYRKKRALWLLARLADVSVRHSF